MKRSILQWPQSMKVQLLEKIPNLRIFIQYHKDDLVFNRFRDQLPIQVLDEIFARQDGQFSNDFYTSMYKNEGQRGNSLEKYRRQVKKRQRQTRRKARRAEKKNIGKLPVISQLDQQKLYEFVSLMQERKEQWKQIDLFKVMKTENENYEYILWHSTKQMRIYERTDEIVFYVTAKCLSVQFEEKNILQEKIEGDNWDCRWKNVWILKGKQFTVYWLKEFNIFVAQFLKQIEKLFMVKGDLLVLSGSSRINQDSMRKGLKGFQKLI